ncbi:MAG: Gfo/Idh/MocA family oxidoreductase [Candidatus Brocadiae bacterium]|nr:Gfo/Idh/MocA family oxidoreductase [Candidatus Brocadiia bacterium]
MRPTRRAFLRSAALAAAPFVVRASALGKDGRPAASERITLGMIGLGSMGLRHVKGFVQEADCQITHACDVDYARRRTALGVINKAYQTADCAEVHDFRDVIENPHIDAFVISLPDHWHAVPCLMACRAGKDVYGEKPLALTIADGQAMVRAVRQAGIVWQMGSWQRSTRHFRFACELVRNGRLGKIQRVDVGLAEGFRPQGRKMCHLLEAQKAQPVPKGFDYNMWLGPAPWAPYTPLRCHWNFRWILDYSGGQVTDDGAHQLDIAHWGMGWDGTGPLEVEGVGEFPTDGIWDAAYRYRFTCTYAGGIQMRVGSTNYMSGGIKWIGERGWIQVRRGGYIRAEPASLLEERIGPDEIHLASPNEGHRQGHRRDFLDCIKTREEPITPIEVGHRSITVAHLGNLAMRLGRRIRWDPQREAIVGDPTATRTLARAYREPWHL